MRETLLPVYERELRYIRKPAAEFAERYPAVAGRLLLEPDKCEDPHVERLIESFAMLTARVQRRIDEEFPEITDSMLGILYPHTLSPLPSMTIVQFALDAEQGKTGRPVEIDKGALLHTKPVDGVRCRFRTTSPVTLWPLKVEACDIAVLNEGEPGAPAGARGSIRLRLKTPASLPISRLSCDRLSFFLDGDPATTHRIYETLFRAPLGVLVRLPAGVEDPRFVPCFLGPQALEPGGFREEESMLPAPPQSALALLLLQEYFAFPDKFLFASITGLSRALSQVSKDEVEILVLLDQYPVDLVGKISPANMKLGCTPAVNLFAHEAEPASLKHTEVEIQVIPDVHAPYSYEVHSILEVSTTSGSGVREYRPFYSLKHGDADSSDVAFYHPSRRASLRRDDSGTDVYLTLVDRRFDPWKSKGDEVLNVRALCTNRDLPSRLPFGDAQGDFRIEGKPGIASIRCLRKPSASIRAPQRENARWRLVSLLSLNHLSLVGTNEESHGQRLGTPGRENPSLALESFRELLKICDFADSAVSRQRISGLSTLQARRVLRRVSANGWHSPARGLEVVLTFDEDKYAGSSAFLFATLIERFLGLYTTINSFVQTVAISKQREGIWKKWPPRAGHKALL
jgi:type VI secretion system protein ImpG